MHTMTLLRYKFSSEDTVGLLFVDGVFACYTLEDEVREVKVMEETCIPYGVYDVVLSESPKFTPRFGHKMLHVWNVPNFTGILIHPGITERHTAGCVLVGNGVVRMEDGSGRSMLLASKESYDKLYAQVAPWAKNGNLQLVIRELQVTRIEDNQVPPKATGQMEVGNQPQSGS